MRITFITPAPTKDGGVRAIGEYARRLAARGHDVRIVCNGVKQPPLSRNIKNLLKGRPWARRQQGPSHLDDLPGVQQTRLPAFRTITDADVPDGDIVIATWWETAQWVHELSPAKGRKIYFVQHHEVVMDGQPVPRVEASYRLPMKKICCAQWITDLMVSRYGDSTATTVEYGIDATQFTAPLRGKQPRPTVGCMYSTTHFKAIDIAIAAMELAKKQLPDLQAVIFGSKGPEPVLPIPSWARFEKDPSQTRIPELYASCDAWLFSSRCEGFGLPVLEAMACRTPVIGTPSGVAPQAISPGGGILVNMEDAADMAGAIVRIAQLPDEAWRQMSNAAYATAKQYTWDRAVHAFESALLRNLA
jgi:glycosyltransferase involved in cell wall biosynthesis